MILSVLSLLAFVASPVPDAVSGNSAARIVFQFENPQLRPSSYSLVIDTDGSGIYKSLGAADGGGPGGALAAADAITPQPLERKIRISEPLLSQIFSAARSKPVLAGSCEAPKSHVAFTGKKTLTYSGPDGHGTCTFNYSRDQQLNELASNLLAVAFTLEQGRLLAIEHAHSRLSLDQDLEVLQDAAKDGRALAIENIAPELQAIVEDPDVMNRARNRARALLMGGTSRQ